MNNRSETGINRKYIHCIRKDNTKQAKWFGHINRMQQERIQKTTMNEILSKQIQNGNLDNNGFKTY